MRKNTRGFSLIEILAAMLVLGILFGGTGVLFYQSVKVELMAEDRARSNNLARAALEEVKRLTWTKIPLDLDGSGILDWDESGEGLPNNYYTEDGEYHIIRTITVPEQYVKRVTVSVYTIDSPGVAGERDEPDVVLSTDIYKFGM